MPVLGPQGRWREAWDWVLMLHPPTGGFQQLLLEPMLKFHYMLKGPE